jgi:hypothetical protein
MIKPAQAVFFVSGAGTTHELRGIEPNDAASHGK